MPPKLQHNKLSAMYINMLYLLKQVRSTKHRLLQYIEYFKVILILKTNKVIVIK